MEIKRDFAKQWAESLMPNGERTYPESIPASLFNTVRPFYDGDRILFIGDSITHGNHGGHTYVQLMAYFATRYPNIHLVPINKGIDGNTALAVNERFGFDIGNPLDEQANVAVILLGTNDMGRTEYFAGNELKYGTVERRAKRFSNYETELKNVIDNVKKYTTVKRIILLSPPVFDEWMYVANKPTSPGFNQILRRAGQIAKQIADSDEAVDFIDIHTPQLLASQYRRRFYPEGFTVANDRVHPNPETHYVGVNTVLKAMGETGLVSSVWIDLTSKKASAENATVSNFRVTDEGVSYTYLSKSLPLACDDVYRKAERLFPITEELNREIIRIQGLSEGRYGVFEDEFLLTITDAHKLEDGINIAICPNHAGQKDALALLGIMDEGRQRDAKYRDFIKREAVFIRKFKLDGTSYDSLEKDINAIWDSLSEIDRKEAEILLSLKRKERETISENREFEEQIFKMNRPSVHTIEIRKTELPLSPTYKIEYERFFLPSGTTNVNDFSHGLELESASITQDNQPLTELPKTGGNVSVIFNLKNQTLREQSVVLRLFVEAEGKINGIVSETVSYPSGESKPIFVRFNLPPQTDYLRAEVVKCSNQKVLFTGSFPLQSPRLTSVEVGVSQLESELSGNKPTFFGLHLYDNQVPTVRAFSDNAFASVTVRQPKEIGSEAILKLMENEYRLRIVNRPIPYATSITVGGEQLPAFDPEKYEYFYQTQSLPKVECTCPDYCQTSVWPAKPDNPFAIIKVHSVFGEEREYKINFTPSNQ